MNPTNDRREFLKLSALAGSSLVLPAFSPLSVCTYARNGKLDIGIIGAGGKGYDDALGVAGESIVALCDVDEERAGPAFKKFPDAKRYHDFRVMLSKEKLDAVVISTPDHSHAPAAVMAMEMGLGVYCQKPLTHTIEEARVLTQLARRKKVATSMGNQGTGMDGLREGVEVVRSGAIGDVREIHVWTNRPIWRQGMPRNPKIAAIPATLRWDLWLGAAPHRPYNADYAPFKWRGFWDFGTGALGDMACHILNLPYMALELGAPVSVEGESSGCNDESAPHWSTIIYEFPARGALPPVKFTWYDGKKDGKPNRPSPDLVPGLVGGLGSGGSIMIGAKGVMHSKDDYGSIYKLYPEDRFVDFKPPTPSLPRAPGEKQTKIYQEWIANCKGGPACLANFDYAGPMTETVLLGNVAIRTGEKLQWDAAKMRATNCTAAERYLRKDYTWGFGIG
jgi:predicted dehydrogenase